MRIHGISKDWFKLWYEDKQSVLRAMRNNMKSDIDAGYNIRGACIMTQKRSIEEYEKTLSDIAELFKTMNEKEIQRWCFYDMIKRGSIEL